MADGERPSARRPWRGAAAAEDGRGGGGGGGGSGGKASNGGTTGGGAGKAGKNDGAPGGGGTVLEGSDDHKTVTIDSGGVIDVSGGNSGLGALGVVLVLGTFNNSG